MDNIKYNDFPTFEEINRDYNDLMKIIKDVNTIDKVKEITKIYPFTIEINGMSLKEFLTPDSQGYICCDKDIEWIRYESYGCLSYIYVFQDGKIFFDVWSEYCYDEFIRDITIDKLTKEFYNIAKVEALK